MTAAREVVFRGRRSHHGIDFVFLQAGDKVVYSKYAGTEVALEGVDYVLLKVVPPPYYWRPSLVSLDDRSRDANSHASVCTGWRIPSVTSEGKGRICAAMLSAPESRQSK